MPSRFAWIDIDEASRRTMLDFIDTFREQGTLDEIGIGTIRDAISDFFFPGTTTVQTRARYFLFVPWIYRRLEDKRVASADMARRLKDAEYALLLAMLEAGVPEGERLIGRQSRYNLQRWPSSIYWAGLGTWGIRKFPGSQEAYHRSLDAYYRGGRSLAADTEGDVGDQHRVNWDQDAHFPGVPEGFPAGVTMQLSSEDAAYLSFKIRTNCPGTLLAELLVESAVIDASAIWMLPGLADLPPALGQQIDHAHWIARVVHGANLLYYWSVAKADRRTALTDAAEAGLTEWAASLAIQWGAFRGWAAKREAFWQGPAFVQSPIHEKTQRFVDTWVNELVQQGPPGAIWQRESALRIIKDREFQTKGAARARLWNAEQRRRWNPNGLPDMLDFRWGVANWMLSDIRAGLIAPQAPNPEVS
jgi:uncharacterized protein DUF6361